MTYFTADLHLGHSGIIEFCDRPFQSVEEMNRNLIGNWNSRVTDRDDVYILGDLLYRSPKNEIEQAIRRLKGRKHLIVGNHDHTWMGKVDMDELFVEVDNLKVLKLDGRVLVLCHYPMLSWPHMHHGSYCIFGHIHNATDDGPWWSYIRDNCRLLNAGVDVNGFYPVLFDELVENNRRFKEDSLMP